MVEGIACLACWLNENGCEYHQMVAGFILIMVVAARFHDFMAVWLHDLSILLLYWFLTVVFTWLFAWFGGGMF